MVFGLGQEGGITLCDELDAYYAQTSE